MDRPISSRWRSSQASFLRTLGQVLGVSSCDDRISSDNLASRFDSYQVARGALGLSQIIESYKPVETSMVELGLANKFSVYERLLDFLVEHSERFDVRPLGQLLDPIDDDRVRICLRHDIDSLINPALCAATALASRNLLGSFYVLHTAAYYGCFVDKIFKRNPGVECLLKHFREQGQEIGLHIDPLHVYFSLGIDGREAILTEISWMRACGVDLKGVVAHNSAPVYGAENFEIFKGLALNNRRHVTHKGVTVDLQSICMQDEKLEYEGNFPRVPDPADAHLLESYLAHVPRDSLRRSDWLSIYLQHNPVFSRSNDVSIWLLGNDAWAIAESSPNIRFLFNVSHDDMINYLQAYRYRGRIVIVIHPEYISNCN